MQGGSFVLIQMLPLLIFLVVDGIFSNTLYSILSAVVFAIFHMTFTFVKTGSTDYLILIDVALIAALGAVSIIVKNDIFFKIKPAIIESVMILFLLVLVFAPDSFMLSYFGRFIPANSTFTPQAIPILKKMMIGISLYTLLHIGAVWYTAFYSSRKIWAIVSGPGYFFLFIPMMLWIVLKKIKSKKQIQNEINSNELDEVVEYN